MRRTLWLICILGMACLSWAQSDQASWANLSALHAGQKIQIVEMNSKKHSGTFVSVSDTAISCQDGTGDRTFQKQDVQSVKLMKNNRRLRNTLVGSLVGAGAGAGIGAATYHPKSCPPNAFLCLNGIGGRGVPTAIGAVIGLAGGAIVGAVLPAHRTIYRVNSH